jgi:hypothetical protein
LWCCGGGFSCWVIELCGGGGGVRRVTQAVRWRGFAHARVDPNPSAIKLDGGETTIPPITEA